MSKKKNTDFRITPYHVNNSVTGSSVLIEVDGLKILCDLGMFQSQSHKIEDIYKINYKKPHYQLNAFNNKYHITLENVGFLQKKMKKINVFYKKYMLNV